MARELATGYQAAQVDAGQPGVFGGFIQRQEQLLRHWYGRRLHLAGAGLVLLRDPDADVLERHWSAYRAGAIMDPQTGVFRVQDYGRTARLIVCRVISESSPRGMLYHCRAFPDAS